MESSLIRQLRKLALPQTSLLLQNKIRQSFLFDHREASSLGCDAFFAYGTNGLEKLKLMNPLFAKFEQDLFNASSKTFERSVQVKSVNDQLDCKIEEFLIMISPYLLFRAAQEALEWLIYRYHIHFFNINALIASALPHYHTQTFVRVLQLLDLKDQSSQWSWLLSVKNSGEPLQSNALFNRFNCDEGFRKFVCNIAPSILEAYGDGDITVTQPIVSFSMLTVYFSLERIERITNNLISCLLPYIVKAMKSKLSNYKACAYLVISKIVTRVQLSEDVVGKLLYKLFQNLESDLQKETFEIALLIFQQQPTVSLRRSTVSVLWKLSNAGKFLQYLVSNYQCSRFLNSVLKQSVISLFTRMRKNESKSCKEIWKFIKSLLNNVELEEETFSLCFRITLKQYVKSLKLVKNKKIVSNITSSGKMMLKNLERKWPNYFDRSVNSFFKKKLYRKNKLLMKFVNNSVCSVKHIISKDTKSMLVVSVHHANPIIRSNAVKLLLKETERKDFSDFGFLESILLQRLNDDDPNVVAAVLSASKTVVQLMGREDLIKGIGNILSKNSSIASQWRGIQLQALTLLSELSIAEDKNVQFKEFLTLLPFIFPLTKKDSIEVLLLFLNSFNQHIIQALNNNAIKIVSKNKDSVLSDLNCAVIKTLKNYVQNMKLDEKLYLLQTLKEKIDGELVNVSLCIVYLFILEQYIDCCMQSVESLKEILLFFKNILEQSFIYIDLFDENVKQEDIIRSLIVHKLKNKLPASLIFFILSKIIKKVCLEKESFNLMWWPNPQNLNVGAFCLLTEVFEFLILQFNAHKKVLAKNFKKLLSIFINYQFSDIRELFWFMSYFWSNASENVSVLLQVAALNITTELCNDQTAFNFFFQREFNFSSTILVAVANPHVEIRSTALNMLSRILTYKNSNYSFAELCLELTAHSDEIMTDFRQCSIIIENWLKSAYDNIDTILLFPNNVKNDHSKVEVLKSFLNLMLNLSTPCAIRYNIIQCLQDADSPVLLSSILPLLRHYLNQYKLENNTLSKHFLNMIKLLLQKFSPLSVKSIISDNSEEANVLLEYLQLTEPKTVSLETSVQILTVKLMTKDLFFSIPSSILQHKILTLLVDLFINSGSSEVNAIVGKTLKKLCASATLILKVFQEPMVSKRKKTTLREVKRSITQDNSKTDPRKFDKMMWQRITVILEMIQNKTKINGRDLLIPELFVLLNKTLDFESESSVEYLRQLILSTIYNCCQVLGIDGLNEKQFQVELIVHCIRSSTNPKTHHQSLLLLNLAATMFPEYVLSNVMSIFTFMGSSLIRQDDSYSFQVISQTIETIVPALLEASSLQKENDANEVVASVIRVFVDSLMDIPRHRQLPLFIKLVTTLGGSEFLWIPLSQICDQYRTMFHNLSEREKKWEVSPVLEFATNLHAQFSPAIQIETVRRLLDFIAMLPDTKQNMESNVNFSKFKEPFDLANHNDEQLKIFKYNILLYVNIWLSSPVFFNQVSDLDMKAQNSLEEKYESLFEVILSFLEHQLNLTPTLLTEKKDNIITSLYSLINNVNALLPCKLFIKVIKRLLKNPILVIQQKAIELLNSKLESEQVILSDDDEIAILKVLRPLLKIIKNNLDESSIVLNNNIENSVAKNIAINRQIALFSLHLLTKRLGLKYPEKFNHVLSLTIILLSNETIGSDLIVNTLLCLAQLCKCLQIHVLPSLNLFMPMIIKLLETDSNSSGCDNIILGAIVALQSLVENLGVFMSSYMEDIITNICILSVKYSDKKGTTEIKVKLESLKSNLAKDVTGRVLLPAIEKCYEKILSVNKVAICSLMDILADKMVNTDFKDVKPFSQKLQQFYLKLLDFRCLHYSPDLCSTIFMIEKNIIMSLITFVLKISETDFRNFFQAIYLWATSSNEQNKIFTFYRLTYELSVSLKNIFSLFAKYFIKSAASVLDLSNTAKGSQTAFNYEPVNLSSQLLNFLIDTLNFCFHYDNGYLLDKESFNVLMQPLVDQIENLLGSDDDFKERIENHLSICIGNFMAAVSDHTLWKALNYQILLKTRHSMAKIRFGSLQVIREVVKQMGDKYLSLLPESIPFLAEMMEDESSEVEEECRSIITDMEKILGEPLKNLFK